SAARPVGVHGDAASVGRRGWGGSLVPSVLTLASHALVERFALLVRQMVCADPATAVRATHKVLPTEPVGVKLVELFVDSIWIASAGVTPRDFASRHIDRPRRFLPARKPVPQLVLTE